MSKLIKSVDSVYHSVRKRYREKINSAIILGSGLSSLELDGFETIKVIDYKDINGLPKTTAPSHKGEIRIVYDGKRYIALCAGRHHLYEGYSAHEVVTLTYALRKLGAEELTITNAAGALNPSYTPGDVMLIEDHINFTGQNPIVGQDESFGVIFPDMSQAYHPKRLQQASDIAKKHRFTCHTGTYIGVIGPSLETSAERRMMRSFGADSVGMSTVLETIAANHCGMRVLGMSAITNLATGDKNQTPDTIEEVLENAAIAAKSMEVILNELLSS